jgi:hypothetical protein
VGHSSSRLENKTRRRGSLIVSCGNDFCGTWSLCHPPSRILKSDLRLPMNGLAALYVPTRLFYPSPLPVRFQLALESFLLGHRRIRLREPAIRHFASIKAIPATRVPPFYKPGIRFPSTSALRRWWRVFYTKCNQSVSSQRFGDFDLDSPNSCSRHDKHGLGDDNRMDPKVHDPKAHAAESRPEATWS